MQQAHPVFFQRVWTQTELLKVLRMPFLMLDNADYSHICFDQPKYMFVIVLLCQWRLCMPLTRLQYSELAAARNLYCCVFDLIVPLVFLSSLWRDHSIVFHGKAHFD
ncbi:hypothetical protein AcV7_006320 [Taiwanofungus camphoratus]|nr:hypothetical protein AcV7_006320 [Antrodia cinnamomea]